MLTGLAFALANSVVLAILSGVFRNVGRRQIPVVPFYAAVAVLSVAFVAPGVHWTRIPAALPGLWPAAVLALAVSGIANGVACGASIVAMGLGHGAISFTVIQSAMILTFLWSTVVWHEPTTPIRIAGAVAIVVMFVFVAPRTPAGNTEDAARRHNLRWIAVLLVAFVSNGVAQICYTMPSRQPGWNDDAGLRVPVFLVVMAVGSAAVAVVRRQPVRAAMIPAAALCAALTGVSLHLLAAAADRLAPLDLAGLVYPVTIAGGGILFGLYSRFGLREDYSWRHWTGMAAGLTGIVLLCLPANP